MREAGYLRLWRKPYIWKELGMIRWPSVLELHWRDYFGFGLRIMNQGDDGENRWPWMFGLHLAWISLYLHFPAPIRPVLDRDGNRAHGEWEQWGFHTFDGALVLLWGRRQKHIHYPWTYTFIYLECLRKDGTWEREPAWRYYPGGDGWNVRKNWKDGNLSRDFTYTYRLKNGDVQLRVASVVEEKFHRRRRFLKWTSWLEWVDHCIDITFNDEVGERTGSWKGGCIGCGYTILPGETAEQCLRRMERERKF